MDVAGIPGGSKPMTCDVVIFTVFTLSCKAIVGQIWYRHVHKIPNLIPVGSSAFKTNALRFWLMAIRWMDSSRKLTPTVQDIVSSCDTLVSKVKTNKIVSWFWNHSGNDHGCRYKTHLILYGCIAFIPIHKSAWTAFDFHPWWMARKCRRTSTNNWVFHL